jgi:hypothetical protein
LSSNSSDYDEDENLNIKNRELLKDENQRVSKIFTGIQNNLAMSKFFKKGSTTGQLMAPSISGVAGSKRESGNVLHFLS